MGAASEMVLLRRRLHFPPIELFTLVGGSGLTGFNLDSVYSAGIAALGAIIALAVYHAFFRRRMTARQEK
jgi:uncharacterized membrane protein YdjX (TVP38/TMEM64 family)